MAKVKVRLFARLADLAGTREAEVEIGEGLTAGDVFAALAREHPRLEGMRVAFAVNEEYAEEGRALREGDEVALIPPVSGGARSLSSRPERSGVERSATALCLSSRPASLHIEVAGLSTPSAAAGSGRDDRVEGLRSARNDKRAGRHDAL